jgi:uncharacterized membrane protein YsdA (DUF1294 family)
MIRNVGFFIIGVYLFLINAITYLLFWKDKQRAKKHQWRISEKTLLVCCVLGGGLGGLFGTKKFHHKTKNPIFYIGIPLMIIVELIAIGLAIW